MTDIVQAHEVIAHLVEEYNVLAHPQRKGESPEFLHNVQKLKQDGHYQCWISGGVDNLQVHHISEWSMAGEVDFDKLKATLMILDFYGYSNAMKDVPLTSVDDIRNLLVLEETYHIASVTGIHSTTFPAWLSQRNAKDGVEIVPRDHAVSEQAIDAKQVAQAQSPPLDNTAPSP